MARYRIDSIADLARQMQFTPLATRAAQVTSAEGVLHDIDRTKAYPLDWLIFRITGYRPKKVTSDLLAGIALQHDLGLLIEQVSQSLNQRSDCLCEPVLSLDEATKTFNITGKTLQRWRRRGLSGRKLIFPDGKKRIGFLLSHLERFLAVQGRRAMGEANFSLMDGAEREKIISAAQRLSHVGENADTIARRLSRKFNRSSLLISQTIRENIPAIDLGVAQISEDQRGRIYRRYRRGVGLSELALTFRKTKSAIYFAILDERLARVLKRKSHFIDDPLYHQADAEQAINAIASQEPLVDAPARLCASDISELCNEPPLTDIQERALFLKLNFHKYQFMQARRRLDERRITHRRMLAVERHLRQAIDVRNRIVRANLRLLVSIARRHARGCVGWMDLISDGSLTLMRSVENFDFHKGHQFSTYATFGLMKEFARSSGRMIAQHKKSAALEHDVPDNASVRPNQIVADRDQLNRILSILSESERKVLLAQYGLDGRNQNTNSRQTARQLGISSRQVRLLEESAMAKLRAQVKDIV